MKKNRKEKILAIVLAIDRNLARESIERAIREKSEFKIENRIVRRDGSLRWVFSSGYIMTDENHEPQRFVGLLRDITEIKQKQDEMLYMSHHDYLTGVYNRRFLDEELNWSDTESNLPKALRPA